MENKQDNELMYLVAEKNTQALKIIYKRYEMRVFNFIYRYTGSRGVAQELIQETFTRLWFSAHLFDERKGNFKGWLYTMALNITRNEMSKKEYLYGFKGMDETVQHLSTNNNGARETPEQIYEESETRNSVINALTQLKPYIREVIILKNYDHLKFKEIAEVTGAPEGTVKARYLKGIDILKAILNPKEVINHV